MERPVGPGTVPSGCGKDVAGTGTEQCPPAERGLAGGRGRVSHWSCWRRRGGWASPPWSFGELPLSWGDLEPFLSFVAGKGDWGLDVLLFVFPTALDVTSYAEHRYERRG